MAVKCKFIQRLSPNETCIQFSDQLFPREVYTKLLQKLRSSFLTNCFQENWVAASKVSGAPIFRARILASRPNQVICPISDKVVLLNRQGFLPQDLMALRQELANFGGQVWKTCPSKFGASIPNLWACCSPAPVYSCENQPTKVMQCISPENRKNG